MSYQQAAAELAKGTPAEVICATCPWDRHCVSPPTMTREDIEKTMREAREMERAQNPESHVGQLMTALVFAGRDTSGQLCPVFALRLRGPDGRQVADSLRSVMRKWGEHP